MNIQEYISSGIVESYVLGLASATERSEFEELCRQYQELLKARQDFELALEKQAMENAIAPPADLKNKIVARIIAETPGVISLEQTPVKKINWLKYAAAACLILLAGSLYYNISLYKKNRALQTENEMSLTKLNDMEKDMRILQQNPAVKMAALKGLEASPQSFATVFWDTTSHDVYLMLNNLPKPASDKQYQLWALLDGKPIDMGLIDNDYFIKENHLLIKAKNIQQAQAFAITLEKKGRTDTSIPQGDMYVLGKL